MSSRTSIRSSSELTSDRVSGASQLWRTRRTFGTTAIDCFRPTRSRGPALPSAARATSRSRSCTLFRTSRNLPRSVLRNANSSTASRRSRMRSSDDERPQQPRAQQTAGHGRDRAIDLVKQRAVAAAVHRLDDLQMLQRDGVDQQAIGRRLVGDGCARARGRPSACRAGSGAARRPRRPPMGGRRDRIPRGRSCGTARSASARGFVLEGPGIDAGHGQPIGGAVDQQRGSGRDRPARRFRAGAEPSLRRPAPASPALPVYSAQENSPVVRSSSATPTTGSAPVILSIGRERQAETPARARRDAANRSAFPARPRGRSRA